MDRKGPAMPNAKTTAGTDDNRPAGAGEVWIAIGPFDPITKKAIVRGVFFLLVLGTAAVVGVVLIHGDGQERNDLLREQNRLLRAR